MTDRADDVALLAELAAVLAAADPVPLDVLGALRAGFSHRDLDAELAQLVYDSLLDDHAGVRSGAGPRQLSFEAPGLTVEVELAAGERNLVGQVVPPGPSAVEILHPDGATVVDVDGLGRFSARDVPGGPVSFRCRGSAAGSVTTVTDWVVL